MSTVCLLSGRNHCIPFAPLLLLLLLQIRSLTEHTHTQSETTAFDLNTTERDCSSTLPGNSSKGTLSCCCSCAVGAPPKERLQLLLLHWKQLCTLFENSVSRTLVLAPLGTDDNTEDRREGKISEDHLSVYGSLPSASVPVSLGPSFSMFNSIMIKEECLLNEVHRKSQVIISCCPASFHLSHIN